MKITKNELKQIIKEELDQSLDEQQLDEGAMGVVLKALQSPQVQQMLLQLIQPMIQKAIAGSAPAAE